MAYRLVVLLVLATALGACGKEIGDACSSFADCSPDGDRVCDPSSPEGYCTIRGCDYSTCPDEAVCVRFYTGGFANRTCASTADCNPADVNHPNYPGSPDERCSLGSCVATSSEVRYCMRTCGSAGDCRDGYECRDLALMTEHGGEPVLAPGELIGTDPPNYCAATP